MRWECRYSSCEMMYFEIVGDEIHEYFDHSADKPRVWSFQEVLDGHIDGDVRNMFAVGTIKEIKEAVQKAMEIKKR